jgi:hypothetical protein
MSTFTMVDQFLSSRLRLLLPAPVANKFKPKIFHPFSRLPAELRLRIWEFALDNDPATYTRNRNITISRFKGRYRVTINQRYSSLFAVNRECRYEAATMLGGAWVRLEDPVIDSARKRTLCVYIQFDRDNVLLRGCKDLFVLDGKSIIWQGRPVAIWQYGRNLESPDPMYTIVSNAASTIVDCGC